MPSYQWSRIRFFEPGRPRADERSFLAGRGRIAGLAVAVFMVACEEDPDPSLANDASMLPPASQGDAGAVSSHSYDGGAAIAPPPRGSCPTASPDDVWLDRRLSCVQPGERFVDSSRLATGETKIGIALRISQTAYGDGLQRINGGRDRAFAHFLCVRNAPVGLHGQPGSIYLGTDLLRVMKLGGGMALLPSGITHSSFNLKGGFPETVAYVPCDPAVHPLIVDFQAGTVESVNAAALSTLRISDVEP